MKVAVSVRLRLYVGLADCVRVCVQVRYRVSVGVKVSRTLWVTVVQVVNEWRGVEEPDTETVLVLDALMLAVWVEVRILLDVRARLVEIVAVADWVFVVAPLLVPQEVCVELFELLVEEV